MCMRVEDIIKEWESDCEIDMTNIAYESACIPKLHNKYFKIYMGEGYLLKKIKADYKQFVKLKTEYYKGELSSEELNEHGWEPQLLKILRQDIPTYIESDSDIIEYSLKVGRQDQKVEYLESIIKMINNRGYQLKTIVDYEKFRSGVA